MDRAHSTFIDGMGQLTESDGMSPIAGRLFAVLILSPGPRSLDELAAELGVSKASASTDARRLLERGIVRRVTHTGDRRDYYELAPDFFAQIIRHRVDRWRHLLELISTMRDSATDLDPAVRDHVDSIKSIQASVVDRVEDALLAWERRGATNTAPSDAEPTATPSSKPSTRRRRTA
jgi:DNA-binding transcriptional regulator GbsR (MarR family)